MNEAVFLLIVEAVCGAAGGLAVSAWLRNLSLGITRSTLTGAVGGLILTFVAARIPGIDRLVGHVENAADAVTRHTGGLTPTVLAGVGIAGVLGGVLLTMLVGLARNRSARKN